MYLSKYIPPKSIGSVLIGSLHSACQLAQVLLGEESYMILTRNSQIPFRLRIYPVVHHVLLVLRNSHMVPQKPSCSLELYIAWGLAEHKAGLLCPLANSNTIEAVVLSNMHIIVYYSIF